MNCGHKKLALNFSALCEQQFTIFKEEALSALAGFHAGPLVEMSLEMLVFVEGGKLENLG